VDIAIGDEGGVWAIGATNIGPGGNGVFQWNGSSWVQDPSGAAGMRIAVERNSTLDGRPWVVTANNQIWRRDGTSWTQMPGSARDIGAGGILSANGSEVFIIGTDAQPDGYGVHRWIESSHSWQPVFSGGGVRIDVDQWGIPWMVSASQKIWRGSPPHPLGHRHPFWTQMPGNGIDIAAGASAWVLGPLPGPDFQLFRFDAQGAWVEVAGQGVAVAAAINNEPWLVDSAGHIFEWTF
jgi:hypothetical protein